MYHLCIIKYLKTSQRCLVGYKICYLGIDVRFEQNNILVHVETCVTSLCTQDVDIKQKKPTYQYGHAITHNHLIICTGNHAITMLIEVTVVLYLFYLLDAKKKKKGKKSKW